MIMYMQRLLQQVDLMKMLISTTYLGRIYGEEVLKAEESFPISEQGFVG